MGHVFEWWLTVTILGFLSFPLTFLTFRYLPDKGYAFSKILSLFLLGYFSWILGYVAWNVLTIFSSVLLLIFLFLYLLSKTWVALIDFLKQHLGYILIIELLFFTAFFLACSYKMRTPAILGTEKPMDFTMINGILTSAHMPPHDPWLAGGNISYYYFGYLLMAMLIKLTWIKSSIGYNLGVALIWALAAVEAFGLVYALTRKYRYAAFSSLALTVLGNLDFWYRAVQSYIYGDLRVPYYNMTPNPNAVRGLQGFFDFVFSPLHHYWDYFQASRIIPVSATDKMINEFPSFSFFLSDLHPHLMVIPLDLLAIALAFNLLKSPLKKLYVFGERTGWQIAQLILLALVFGSLGFTNSWDYPSLILLLTACLALQQYWALADTGEGVTVRNWVDSLWKLGLPIYVGTFLFYLPFYWKFQSQAYGIGIVHNRTNFGYFIVIVGLFLIFIIPAVIGMFFSALTSKNTKNKIKKAAVEFECVLCKRIGREKKFCGYCGGELIPVYDTEVMPLPDGSFKTWSLTNWSKFFPSNQPLRKWLVLISILILIFILNLGQLQFSVVLFSIIFIILLISTLLTKSANKEMVFITLVLILAFSIMLGCELIFVRDEFQSTDLYRMNTFFKFYFQIWILFSIASGPLIKWIFENQWKGWHLYKKTIWLTIAIIGLIGSGLYPILTLISRTKGIKRSELTLNGNRMFDQMDPSDAAAIHWIERNIKPINGKAPVILEAWGGSYTNYARVSMRTGYPTVLGWNFHEAQWRGSWNKAVIPGGSPYDTVLQRQSDVDTIYKTTNLETARQLLQKYGVKYVYIGYLEMQKYPNNQAGFSKFSQLGNIVYSNDGVTIYKING